MKDINVDIKCTNLDEFVKACNDFETVRKSIRDRDKMKDIKVRTAISIVELDNSIKEFNKDNERKRKEIVKEYLYNMLRLDNARNIFGGERNIEDDIYTYTIRKSDITYLLELINYNNRAEFKVIE